MEVALFVALMCAPGTTAPEGSVTVPLIAPRNVCALAGTTNNRTNKSTTSSCFIFDFLSIAYFCRHHGSREALHRAERRGFPHRETQIHQRRFVLCTLDNLSRM